MVTFFKSASRALRRNPKGVSFKNPEEFLSNLIIWGKVLNNGASKICGRPPLKILKEYDLLKKIY